ncbi:MAG: amidohydrolase [Candidatus Obscuribacterales bacterium]|nr:amidohydrolase [Candidatus Obscuribacterales bacterium]
MKPLLVVFLVVLSAMLACQPGAAADLQTHADIVLVNGSIYTMDSSRRWAQAVAISNGRIVFVGTDQDAVKYAGPLSNTINLQGKLVLPGFVDSHVHPLQGALEEAGCYLNDYTTLDSLKKAIKDYATEHPDEKWISGAGWDLPIFGKNGPEKALLDELVPDRPAYLVSSDGHSSWVNSKALELAGVTAFTPDPTGGRIERIADKRDPSGTLREAAMDLVDKLVPKPDDEQHREAALAVQKKFNKLGIVGVQDASVDEPSLKAYASLDDSNLLTMRVSAAMHLEPEKGEGQIATFKTWRDKYDGNLLRARSVKIFADGVIESKTAAMLEPYTGGDEKDTGILEFAPNLFKWYACKLDAAGFQIHIHAIGDRAVRTALDAIEIAQKINGRSDKRHHIAHLELIDAKDVNRFRDLNVTANFQPYWAFRDKYVSEMTEPILGAERSNRLYQIGSLFRSGATVVGGSDWTVTTVNPFDAIQVAVTRCGLNETADKVFIPEERVTLPEILAAYTINGAWLGHWEKESGSIEVGKSADIIILDTNIFAVPPSEIHKTKVLWTLFKGRAVYRDADFDI